MGLTSHPDGTEMFNILSMAGQVGMPASWPELTSQTTLHGATQVLWTVFDVVDEKLVPRKHPTTHP
jgi:hypothetical protein